MIVWDPPAEGRAAAAGFETVPSVELLAERVNHLCLHVPALPETSGIVDADLLARLGEEGHLVNCSRGSLVDEPALLAWLERSPAAFASLDVLAVEPPEGTSETLARHPRVLATPHVAYLSTASLPRLRRTAASHVLEALVAPGERERPA